MPPPIRDETQRRQRRRFLEALLAVVTEHGYGETTLDLLLAEAGLEEAEFARSYPDLEVCFAALWEACRDDLVARTSAAFLGAGGRCAGVRAAAWESCRWLQENPDRGHLFLVEVSFAGELARAARDHLLARYADRIHISSRPGGAPPVAREHAEAIVGAIWQRASTAVRAGGLDSLPALVPQLMYTAVLPYFGAAAAREELRRGPVDIALYERGEVGRTFAQTSPSSEVRYRLSR